MALLIRWLDMLDQFVPPKPEADAPSSSSRSTTTTAATHPQTTVEDGALSDEEFAKQLQEGMAELLGNFENDPTQFEAMMKELTTEASLTPQTTASTATGLSNQTPLSSNPKKKSAKSKSGEAPAEDFQETIRKTMERLKASGSSASEAAASSTNSEEDLMAEMLKAMQASGFDGENGLGSEEDFSKMLLGVMEQLTNKEILYEPMKELDDKFPEWMTKNEGKVKGEDMKRYKEQQVYVKEIVARFEAKGYSDDNVADREYIVERMQKVRQWVIGRMADVLTVC